MTKLENLFARNVTNRVLNVEIKLYARNVKTMNTYKMVNAKFATLLKKITMFRTMFV